MAKLTVDVRKDKSVVLIFRRPPRAVMSVFKGKRSPCKVERSAGS